jgi:protein-S-isoprenylcysteine O-methyltransferase Ste14
MQRSDKIVIGILIVLAVVGEIAIALLTLLEGPEWIEFVIVMVLFVAILAGAYWFVLAPQSLPEERDEE